MAGLGGLSAEVVDEIRGVVSRFPVVMEARIFGSRAKGNFKRYSDVDIAIFGDFGVDVVMELRDELEELYVIYRFDVVHYDTLKNCDLREHIDRVGINLCRAVECFGMVEG